MSFYVLMYEVGYGYDKSDDAFSVTHFFTHVLVVLRVRPSSLVEG
jgi:hypothetical protein